MDKRTYSLALLILDMLNSKVVEAIAKVEDLKAKEELKESQSN